MNGWAITIGIIGIAALLGAIYLVSTNHGSIARIGNPASGKQAVPVLSLSSTRPSTYHNREEIELLDFDPELLMPRRIVIHRHAEVR